MERAEKKICKGNVLILYNYRIFIKHSNNNKTFVECMKEAIKTTIDKSSI